MGLNRRVGTRWGIESNGVGDRTQSEVGITGSRLEGVVSVLFGGSPT